ncbi:MAG: efflux RND transporter permease subunit [Saprospiraceae bacterium]|nr:efflux RND transporter permease subunit [Saprospiraceae bacterium]MCC6413554.1 efflux RND transporter permease subunit [Saprospiraceae bacterium]
MKIAEFSVKNSQFTFIVFLAVMALGISSLLNMPRAEDPKFAPAGYNVIVVYPGAGPAEIEEKITDKVEEKLGALENIDRMRSKSLNGFMVLTIEFIHGEDPDKKYEELVREVNALRPELPDDLNRVTIQRFASSDVAILQAGLVSETASWADLRHEAERLEEMAEKIPGVKAADTWGFPKREVRISLNLPKMASDGIPVSRVLGALQSENVSIPGGSVNVGDRQFFVETSGDYETIEEVRNTIVFANAGKIVYLKDLATVEYAYEEPRHFARINGSRAVWVTVRMKDGQNIFDVGDAVNKTVAEFKEELPSSMDYVKVFDQNDSVRKRLTRFAKDFGIAILLVLLTLLPLGWRAALVVMISIPLSIAIGLFALDKLGYTLNQLSIVGLIIALGILVDDSIVVVENIERWLREGHKRKEAAILATRQIGLAVLGCTATLILAFLPLVYLPEASGDFIRSLPMAVVTTVIASLFVSLTIVPFLGSRLLAEHHDPRGNIFLRGLKWAISKSYARLLDLGLRFPKTTLLVSAVIFFAVLALAGRVGFTVFPASERPMFYIDIDMASGSSLEQTDRVGRIVDSVLAEYVAPEFRTHHLLPDSIEPISLYPGDGAPAKVTWYATNVGRGNPRVYYNVIRESESPDYGQVFVQLQEHTPPPVKIAMIDELRAKFRDIPGAVVNVKNFEQGPPIEAAIAIRVAGENFDTLRRVSAEVEKIVAETEGTIYVDNPIATIKTDLVVNISKDKATSLGIPIAEIDRMVRLSIAGLNAGSFTAKADAEDYNLTVTVPKTGAFASLDALKGLYINSLNGSSVPLGQVADIGFKPSPNYIEHYDKERFSAVTASVKSGYFAADVNAKIKEKLALLKFPKGYSYRVAGEQESAERSFGGMGTIVLITIFGLLAVLILEFKTFRSTIIVLSVIPLGIIGAILMLMATGYPFSFTVMVGLIALMGIEVKNSILLVDFTNQLRAEGRGLDEAIRESGEIRFVPILLTSLTAIGGLLPLAIEENPLYSPLAYVLIGGLISSTLLSRIVTPVMYKLLKPM